MMQRTPEPNEVNHNALFSIFLWRSGVDSFLKPYPDVLSAIQSGMQACYLNLSGINLYQHPDTRILPHVEINNLNEIERLLYH